MLKIGIVGYGFVGKAIKDGFNKSTTFFIVDPKKNTTIEDGILYIDNQIVKSYTFKQDYFFMMGDNRHNSEDSRFWGFVPYDHILGEASFIWFSFNYQEENIFKAIRWSRFFNVIR